MDVERKKPVLSIISSILAGINLFIFIYLVFINPKESYYGFTLCFIPVVYLIYALGWSSLFIIPVIFLFGIVSNIIRQYRLASIIILFGGFLTFPVGILGIISSIILWSLSALPKCPVCKYPLEEDWDTEGKYLCPNCKRYFGMVEMKKNH
jgi:hypothetical protein